MPAGDDYLTRARRSVVMFTARGQCSHFLRELEADGAVAITDTDGKAVREEGCPSCKQGVLNIAVRPIRRIPLLLELPRLQLQAKRTSSAISKCIDLKEACDNYSWHCHVGSRVRDQPKLLGKNFITRLRSAALLRLSDDRPAAGCRA